MRQWLVEELARQACVVVTDDYPCFFHPHMIKAVARKLPARLELIDSNCLMPLKAWDRTFTVAHSYRRAMQKSLPNFLDDAPDDNPLLAKSTAGIPSLKSLPGEITKRWPAAKLEQLLSDGGLSKLAIDHSVKPAPLRGGSHTARTMLRNFVKRLLDSYSDDRNHPDLSATSQLSLICILDTSRRTKFFGRSCSTASGALTNLRKPNGSMEGFWNVSPSAEAFLDQLVTWREIGFNMCQREPNYDRYESLPAWARQTLADHESDPRPKLYSFEELEQGRTYDRLWNAAQTQLVRDGRIHNYLRMVWGKRFLEWTPNAKVALDGCSS